MAEYRMMACKGAGVYSQDWETLLGRASAIWGQGRSGMLADGLMHAFLCVDREGAQDVYKGTDWV